MSSTEFNLKFYDILYYKYIKDILLDFLKLIMKKFAKDFLHDIIVYRPTFDKELRICLDHNLQRTLGNFKQKQVKQ